MAAAAPDARSVGPTTS